jgi:diguanylate cyclase (GGDEF)-like protein
VAARVQEASLAEAVVARLGGEEFAWLSAFEPAVAAQQADQVRRAIEADRLVTETGDVCRVTVSAGVTGSAPNQSPEGSAEFCLRRFLERADQLLYQAKRAGRNRIRQEAIR